MDLVQFIFAIDETRKKMGLPILTDDEHTVLAQAMALFVYLPRADQKQIAADLRQMVAKAVLS